MGDHKWNICKNNILDIIFAIISLKIGFLGQFSSREFVPSSIFEFYFKNHLLMFILNISLKIISKTPFSNLSLAVS